MLNWLAGQKQADGPVDPDATGYVEPPETPAPVFAVRAFKHAIFGTPQTTQPQPRRHSNVENARPTVFDPKPARPGIGRPKSSSDAPTMAKQDCNLEVEPLSSPTKGILLSPGIGTARRKNVTFGENVVDNEEKRPLRSGMGEDSPAKLPGACDGPSEETRKRDESPRKGSKSRTKLTDALEQARDESKKRKSKAEKRGRDTDADELPSKEFASPKSESGKYWKREYDIYRTNTQNEVKKLITKQKAAKSFAQMKDEECTELAAQLKQEQKKVERLEVKSAELSSLVENLQNQLRASKDGERVHKDELAKLKATARGVTFRPAIVMPEPLFDHHRSEDDDGVQPLRRTEKTRSAQSSSILPSRKGIAATYEEDPVQRPSEPYNGSASSETEKPKSVVSALSETDKVKTNASDDIWAQSFQSSSSTASQRLDKANSMWRSRKGVPSDIASNPLQSLNLNTLTTNAEVRRRSGEHDKPASAIEISEQRSSESRTDKTLDPSQLASARVSQLLSDAKASQHNLNAYADAKIDDDVLDGQVSSPFQTVVPVRPPRGLPPLPTTAGSKTGPANTKENVAPDAHRAELKPKPSTAWNSMNTASTGKRNASLTGKDGKEVSLDRIEAARARIAARSRGTAGA